MIQNGKHQYTFHLLYRKNQISFPTLMIAVVVAVAVAMKKVMAIVPSIDSNIQNTMQIRQKNNLVIGGIHQYSTPLTSSC
jgi:hypothetical protein